MSSWLAADGLAVVLRERRQVSVATAHADNQLRYRQEFVPSNKITNINVISNVNFKKSLLG